VIEHQVRLGAKMEAAAKAQSAAARAGQAAVVVGFVIAACSLVSIPLASGAAKAPTCFGKRPTILGTQHHDSIRGTNGRDVIISFGGHDGIRSRRGNDYVCAGPGDDVVHAAEDVNHMNGGPGDDWLDGRRGPGNVVIGGDGADQVQAEGKIDGGPGNDTLESYGYLDPALSPFPDVTDGGPGNDRIYGCGGPFASQRPSAGPPNAWAWPDCYPRDQAGPSAELLIGGGDNDRIFGGGDNDRLRGSGGNDGLYGEQGNDEIDGGSGTDVCDQGPGSGTVTGCP
jgi:Ca2+-binding RTX toxin-like protein